MALSSLLVLRETAPGNTAHGTMLALHGSGGDVDQLAPLVQAVAPQLHAVLAEGPKTVTAYTVQTADTYRGYCWYPGDRAEILELARFGHALACLEELVLDIDDARRGRLIVLGYEQGAALGLVLASLLPEAIAGAIGICGALPQATGWTLPDQAMFGLPVLLVDEAGRASQATVDALRSRRADVQQATVAGVERDPALARAAIADWLDQRFPGRDTGIST